MGMDIHLSIFKQGKVLAENIYEGRHNEWFQDLQGEGCNIEYDSLPRNWGKSPQMPEGFLDSEKEKWYFGFNYINVKEFKDWYVNKRPDLKAGWATTYVKWMYEQKGIIPEDLSIYRPEEGDPADWHFIEYEDEYEPSQWLYGYLIGNNIPDDADIGYWFDN